MIPAIPLFTPSSSDKSIEYLGKIFGSMNKLLPGEELNILGTMFGTFNTVVLVIGILVIVYVTIVGVMMTAHEGEFMGKKWNNIWIPIRTVVGVAALIPTTSGYSTLQIIMMWVVIQGVGAADTLWTTALNYVDKFGSPYAQAPLPNVSASQQIQVLFKALTCEASARVSAPDPTNTTGGGYFCGENSSNSWCKTNPSFSGSSPNPYPIGPGGACGSLTFCNQAQSCSDASSIQCVACQAQISALTGIMQTLSGVANQFVQADYQYRNFVATSSAGGKAPGWISQYCSANNIPQDQCCIASKSTILGAPPQKCKANPDNTANFPPVNQMGPDNKGDPREADNTAVENLYWEYAMKPSFSGLKENFIKTSVDDYMAKINKSIQDYLQQAGKNTKLPGELGKAQEDGWILAGTFYYKLAEVNTDTLKIAIPAFAVDLKPMTSGPLANSRTNTGAAGTLMNIVSGGTTGASTASNETQNSVGNTMTSVDQSLKSNVQSASNPLAALQITGIVLLWTATALFLALLAAMLIGGLLGNLGVFVLGSGVHNPAGPTLALFVMFIMPAVYALLALLVTLGGMLAVYVPLIPYIIFLFGAVGWFLSVVEAMVAGPLVALGIISPSGEHELLGQAKPALMLLFNIFLRPSLMIFGLIAAMLLASVVVSLINAGFGTVVLGLKVFDPIGLMLILCAYVSLIVGALNKCFAAIYIIPEQVMAWIGSQGAKYGEAEQLGGIKGAVSAGSSKAGGAMGTLKSGADAGFGKKAEAEWQKKDDAKKGKNAQTKLDDVD